MENEEQFERHYRAMSVKIVTWVYVSHRALTLSLRASPIDDVRGIPLDHEPRDVCIFTHTAHRSHLSHSLVCSHLS